jgi:hypothetical protein
MTQAASLAWWSQSRIDQCAKSLYDLLEARCQDWGAGQGAASCEGANAHQARLGDLAWRACGAPSPLGWVSAPPSLAASVGQALFAHPGEPGTLAAEVAARAVDDLLHRLCKALTLPEIGAHDTPPAVMGKPWSGAVVLVITVCDQTLVLLLAPAQSRALFARPAHAADRAPTCPVADALEIELRAMLAPFTLPIDALRGLQAGDVLRMPHRLDQPLTLQGSGVRDIPAWLGEKDGARAMLLSSNPTE